MTFGKLLVMGLTTLALTSSSWALVGGPWDHLIKGVYSRQRTDGLYEASVTMPNGTGFLRFVSNTGRSTLGDPVVVTRNQQTTATGSAPTGTSSLASRSNTVLFYRGNAYYGSVYGTVNIFSKRVSGGGGGQSSVVDSIETALQQFGGGGNYFVNINGISESLNITFNGRVTSQIPEILFEAHGQAIFFSRPNLTINEIGTGTTALTEIRLATPGTGPIQPDAVERIRLFGSRVNLATSFQTTSTTGSTGGTTGGN
ncbi:MAG: hypothetical protein DVB23_001523 [Verrucomicrobia bacterium]|jgi:hypothetical protein|nr:MAG: hypothetical protein DVB23_001523 [Verrucomicrobiota bacterium]